MSGLLKLSFNKQGYLIFIMGGGTNIEVAPRENSIDKERLVLFYEKKIESGYVLIVVNTMTEM